MKIYPEIEITPFEVKTTLRKKHRGVWYLWDFKRDIYRNDADDAMRKIIRDVYMVMLWGTVSPKLKDAFGKPFFKKDPDQTIESIRLMKQHDRAFQKVARQKLK